MSWEIVEVPLRTEMRKIHEEKIARKKEGEKKEKPR